MPVDMGRGLQGCRNPQLLNRGSARLGKESAPQPGKGYGANANREGLAMNKYKAADYQQDFGREVSPLDELAIGIIAVVLLFVCSI